MTPGARIEAAIDLLGKIEAAHIPAEQIVGAYMRGRRYIGAKDRRAIGDRVYGVLRRRARLDWWLARSGLGPGDGLDHPRRSVLADLAMSDGLSAAEIAALCAGSRYAPPPLSEEERAALETLSGQSLDDPGQPPAVRAEVPAWLYGELVDSLGAAAAAELAALMAEAPVDLRVNRLKGDRAAALAALTAEGIEAAPTPLSPLGLRLAGRSNVTATRAFREGLVELQDEGSQIVALFADARPGMAVADLCAGAGGKTLALAAEMAGQGRLVALDVDVDRLQRAGPRLRRACAGFAESRFLPDPTWLAAQAGTFDRVLVDAPCSGSGAWRRQPDARWRLTPGDLARYRSLQVKTLDLAAELVRPGGRLIYATCSLLAAENERQMDAFLGRWPNFAIVPAMAVWAETPVSLGAPPTPPVAGPYLFLTPARHGCDGFFAAALARAEDAP
ncbi:MAG TPA: RsmB/NOP family class I SAM-dependent RNA methyltransferase [Kiloniellales bacterium]